MNQPKSLPIQRCGSCRFEFHLSRYAFCCDQAFDADGEDARVKCPFCQKFVEPIPDEPMELCKYCMRNAVPPLRPDGDVKDQADAPNLRGATGENKRPSEVRLSEISSANSKQPETSLEDPLEGLWRYIGCVCGNQEPDRFELKQAEWSKNSYFCQDCRQPYSSFLWDTELRNDQCPRCSGANIVTDKMTNGDTMIVCQICKSMVSKSRYDSVCREVLDQERQSAKLQTSCPHCSSSQVEMAVAEFDGNPCVVQMCSGCGSKDLLACWNRKTDRFGVPEASEPSENSKLGGPSVPEGFEELIKCCGDLKLMHPVEDDPRDELLTCRRCGRVINLLNCQDKRIPPTVASLRRLLKGKFSSGRMGVPYGDFKVSSLAELNPGDQLDFKKTWYSHHAIVEKSVPDKDELKVIEYTGESNRPTIMAALRFLPSKACVQTRPIKFSEKVKYIRRVDYHSLDCYHPLAVVARAKKRVGEEKYNLIASNCEHFSNWAKANVTFSRQVEALKETARCALRSTVVEITELIDDLPQNGSAQGALIILQDIRADMLRVLDSNSPSIKDFWCPIRLVLKWAIRGIPIAFSRAFAKSTGCKIIWNLDGVFKKVSEKVVDSVTPRTATLEVRELRELSEGKKEDDAKMNRKSAG